MKNIHVGSVQGVLVSIPLLLAMLSAQAGAVATLSDDVQSPAVGAGSNDLAEIVVTANRRTQDVQKVPISVAVLTNAELTAAGVDTAVNIGITTTDVNISNLNDAPLIYIRGMGTDNVVAGNEGPVGLYLDGVYLPYSPAINSNFLDVERIEVLKGPQGTLYGRNTTAGAINLISRDPSAQQAAEGSVTVGSWGTQIVSVYLASGPGKLSASLAAEVTRHDPFMVNLGSGPDFNDKKEFGFRGRVKYEFSDDWSAIFSAYTIRRKDYSGQGFLQVAPRPTAATPGLGGVYCTLANPRCTDTDFSSFGDRFFNNGASVIVKGDVGFANFVSTTGYGNVHYWTSPDVDASNLAETAFTSQNQLWNDSQEFQLISKENSPLNWVTGLYAFHSAGGLNPVSVFNPGNSGCTATIVTSGRDNSCANIAVDALGSTSAYAAYGQADYSIIEGLKVTGGLRYSYEKRSLLTQSVSVPGFGVVANFDPNNHHWSSLDPKVGLDYSWGQQLLYASYSKGFRSGSYNIASPGAEGPVNPEKVDAFEIGGKHTVIPGVRFDWALFYDKYKDLQVNSELNNGKGSLFSTQNAAGAKIRGAEADLTFGLVKGLTLKSGVSYLHARYDSFPNASAYVSDPAGGFGEVLAGCKTVGTVTTCGVDISGRPLSRAPEFTVSQQATYSIPVAQGHIDLNANVYWTSGYFIDTASGIYVPAWSITNIRATYVLPSDHVSLSIFANNVFNKVYLAGVTTDVFGYAGQPNDPRIVGVNMSVKY